MVLFRSRRLVTLLVSTVAKPQRVKGLLRLAESRRFFAALRMTAAALFGGPAISLHPSSFHPFRILCSYSTGRNLGIWDLRTDLL